MSIVRSKCGTAITLPGDGRFHSCRLAAACDARFGTPTDDVLHLFEEAGAVGFELVGDELARGPLVGLLFRFRLRLASSVETQRLPPLVGNFDLSENVRAPIGG